MNILRVYVASSWRNSVQPEIVAGLRDLGHLVYDFRNPPGQTGFSWSAIDPNWTKWAMEEYIEALDDPVAVAGFETDRRYMEWADDGVLVLPAGRSAHLEAGYFVGAKKPLWIVLSEAEFEGGSNHGNIELMYRLATTIFTSPEALFGMVRLLGQGVVLP